MMNTEVLQTQGHSPQRASRKKKTPFFNGQAVQKKLAIGASNDAYEVEADRMADRVVSMSNSEVAAPKQTGALVQRKCAACEQEERVQKKALAESITPLVQKKGRAGAGGVASQALTQQIQSSRGSGNKMDNQTQNYMESRFGTNFSGVNIHTGSRAIQMSRDLNAQAFTVGNDIYFNEGKYNPGSQQGKHLLAHELTHTLQQGKQKNVRRTAVSPNFGDGTQLREEEIRMKSITRRIQMMSERNQSGGSDHIRGNVAPWPNTTRPTGDDHYAYTDTGSRVSAWTAIDYSAERKRYWCHGHTLKTFKNWFYSVYSGTGMARAVADEYNAVSEANVRSGDIAVWTPSYGHSCIIEDPQHSRGALEDSTTKVSSKNGDAALLNTTLAATKSLYTSIGLGPTVGYYRHK